MMIQAVSRICSSMGGSIPPEEYRKPPGNIRRGKRYTDAMSLGDDLLSRLSWSLDRDKLLAELILLKGLASESVIDDCLREARGWGPGSLARALSARGLLSAADLAALERELDLSEREPAAGELAASPGERVIGHYR